MVPTGDLVDYFKVDHLLIERADFDRAVRICANTLSENVGCLGGKQPFTDWEV
jgi:hypothetical protein